MDMRRRPFTPGEVSAARWNAGFILAVAAALVGAALWWLGVEWRDIGVVEAWIAIVCVAVHIIDDVRNEREWPE